MLILFVLIHLVIFIINFIFPISSEIDTFSATYKSTKRPLTNQPYVPPNSAAESCPGGKCAPYINLVAILVGIFCGIFTLILLGIFLAWIYLKKKKKRLAKPKSNAIEHPPLYNSNISIVENSSKGYEKPSSPVDSNSLHYYEKIL